MKLKEWAEKAGVRYLTAYRWFRNGTLPVKAYQTESGTILVDDEELSTISQKSPDQTTDATSLFLKKTIEYSKNNVSIEDFAAYIFSNFDLSLKEQDTPYPKYSKNKPKPEDIQKHFKSFLPVQGKKPELNMYIPDPKTLESLVPEEEPTKLVIGDTPTVSTEINSLASNYSTLLSDGNSSTGSTFMVSNYVEPQGYSLSLSDESSLRNFSMLNNAYSAKGISMESALSPSITFTRSVSAEESTTEKPKRGRPRKIR